MSRRLKALIIKETLQIIRDPSTFLIAFILPIILLFIYGFGVNLDSTKLKLGIVSEAQHQEHLSLSSKFTNSKYFEVTISHDRRILERELVTGHIRGFIVLPSELSREISEPNYLNSILIVTDGSEPNIASFIQNYSKALISHWAKQEFVPSLTEARSPLIELESRFWYNPELKSRHFLIPGSIAIIMTLIGCLLTALVIAREWERGTMEAMMATPISITEILLGKLIPYFVLGMASMSLCVLVATLVYQIPFRGSLLALIMGASVFLVAALGQGLLISTLARDQFVAAQMAVVTAFLPSFMLSGFIFEISSMPAPIQVLTSIVAAKYLVTTLQTLFLAGNIWPLLLKSALSMGVIGFVFFFIIFRKTRKRLD